MKYAPYPKYKDSGVEWLGDVPVGWEVLSLCRLFCVKSGDMTTSTDLLDEGFQVFGGNGFRGFFDNWNTEKGTIIIGRYGALCGNIKISPERIWATEHAFRVFPYMFFHTNFIAFFLEHLNLNRLSARAAQPGLNSEMVRGHLVAFPSHPEQQTIAAFLDQQCGHIDSLIEKKRRMLDLLDEKRRALITQAVTRGLDPTVPMKDSGVEWLGMVPVGWEVLKLAIVAQLQGGFAFNANNFRSAGVPVVRMNNLKRGCLDISEAVFIDETDCIASVALQPNDILFGMSGSIGDTGSLGNFAIVAKNDLPAQLNQRVGRFLCNARNIVPDYIVFFIQSSFFYRQILLYTTGTAQFNVSSKQVESCTIPLPPLPEQQAIADYLDSQTAALDKQRKSIETSIELLREYRASLITHTVTGKIDVRNFSPAQ